MARIGRNTKFCQARRSPEEMSPNGRRLAPTEASTLLAAQTRRALHERHTFSGDIRRSSMTQTQRIQFHDRGGIPKRHRILQATRLWLEDRFRRTAGAACDRHAEGLYQSADDARCQSG